MTTRYDLTLPEAAHTKQRPRFGRGRAYTPAATREWEEWLGLQFVSRHGHPRLAGPVRVEMTFTGVQSNQDIDNLAKSCLDALNGIAFGDDRQVIELVVRKQVEGPPATRILVEAVREPVCASLAAAGA